MNETYSCKACKWWVNSKENPNEGECRKDSPIAAVSPKGEPTALWPITNFNDFCSFQEIDPAKQILDVLSDKSLVEYINNTLETQVNSIDLERGEGNTYIFGRILIETEPQEGDVEKITEFLAETYEFVDIGIEKG